MTEIATTVPKARAIGLWVLRVVVAALFLPPAAMKLTGYPMMVQEFEAIGVGQWFRYFTATLEIVGIVCVLIPRLSVVGAMLLLLVDIGAFLAQAFIFHGDIIHTIVIGLVVCALVYLQRAQLGDILGSK